MRRMLSTRGAQPWQNAARFDMAWFLPWLLRLDAHRTGGGAPDFHLLLQERGELPWRRAPRLEGDLAEAVLHVLAREHRGEVALEALHDLLRHPRRAEQAAPGTQVHLPQARLLGRRAVGHQRAALREHRGEAAQP